MIHRINKNFITNKIFTINRIFIIKRIVTINWRSNWILNRIDIINRVILIDRIYPLDKFVTIDRIMSIKMNVLINRILNYKILTLIVDSYIPITAVKYGCQNDEILVTNIISIVDFWILCLYYSYERKIGTQVDISCSYKHAYILSNYR